MSTPWNNWPLTLKQGDVDPTSFPEYKAIHDRAFLSKMTKQIRQTAIQQIRQAYKKEYNVTSTDGIAIVLMGGSSSDWELYCTDTDKAVFRQEPMFMHLFQLNEPDLYGIIDLTETNDIDNNGYTILGVPFLPLSASRWNGAQKSTEYYSSTYGMDKTIISIDPTTNTTQPIYSELKTRNIHTVLVVLGMNSDSGLMTKTTAKFHQMEEFIINNTNFLHQQLSLLQSIKTELEIEYLRHCCNMSARAHTFVMANIHTCMTELQCESLFTSYCMFYGGSRANAYTCICGSGPNGSILHYGHAAHPNSKLLDHSKDMIVLDMGGEYEGYATDLTRSYPVSGKFTERQKTIYNIVRKAQLAVYDCIKPGVSWPQLHRLSERVILEGLIEIGLIKVDLQKAIDLFLGSLFLPHGLGHLLGLPVHGYGGYIGCSRSSEPGLCWLRLGRNLEKNMVITVEPGIYFNQEWIMSELNTKPEMLDCINMDMLATFWDFGGIRLEDDLVVTENGYELLTGEWPSTVEEIEAVCATFKK